MSKTENKIEDNLTTIIDILIPTIISEESLSNTNLFIDKLKKLKEFIHEKTNSLLSKETLRYQSILFYLSIIFLLVVSIEMKSIKILGNVVSIEKNSLIKLLCIFFTIIIIFMTKAVIDIKMGNSKISFEGINTFKVNVFLKERVSKVLIDEHYKWKVIGLIIKKNQETTSILYKLIDDSKTNSFVDSFESIIDISPFKKDVSLTSYISEREKVYEQISSMIEKDLKALVDKINTRFPKYFYNDTKPINFFEMDNLKKEVMDKWNRLKDKLDSINNEYFSNFSSGNEPAYLADMKSYLKIMKKNNMERKILIFIEVILPVLLALGIFAYFLW